MATTGSKTKMNGEMTVNSVEMAVKEAEMRTSQGLRSGAMSPGNTSQSTARTTITGSGDTLSSRGRRKK